MEAKNPQQFSSLTKRLVRECDKNKGTDQRCIETMKGGSEFAGHSVVLGFLSVSRGKNAETLT